MLVPSIRDSPDRNCYALTLKDVRCTNVAGRKAEEPIKERLRQHALRLDPSSPFLPDVLEQLASAIHCRSVHRNERWGFVRAARDSWLEELRSPASRPISSQTPSGDLEEEDGQPAANVNSTSPTSTAQASAHHQLQHHQRPITRAYATAHGIDPAAIATSEAVFQLYRRISIGKIPELIAQKLQKLLPQRGQPHRRRSGHIYLFTRADQPGYVKIGYSKNVHSRLGMIQEKCQYEPLLGYKSPYILDVYRIEQLIFEQLGGLRQYDMSCIHRVSCQRRHEEWFKISVNDATRVIRQWVNWALQNPYADEGHLREPWKAYVRSWTRHCHRQRLIDGLDLHFGCELPSADEPAHTGETIGRRHDESHASENCSICYETLVFGQERLRACSQCRNCWHDLCIEPWLATSASCPMCRANGTINVNNV